MIYDYSPVSAGSVALIFKDFTDYFDFFCACFEVFMS